MMPEVWRISSCIVIGRVAAVISLVGSQTSRTAALMLANCRSDMLGGAPEPNKQRVIATILMNAMDASRFGALSARHLPWRLRQTGIGGQLWGHSFFARQPPCHCAPACAHPVPGASSRHNKHPTGGA